ncbi:hypothetical protein ABZ848_30540 [Streptomyces sp. NPDC047081]|uniref:hypothetical protein n=1 Tax=Streptomyces sp. NPDC047081 TaxID=3154706 RepID=UPI0033D97118
MLDYETDPYQILIWLYRSDWGDLLGQLAKEHEEITHDLLDGFPSHQRHVQYLRRVLVAAGILQERDEYLDGLPSWLDTLLAAQPAHVTKILRPYASWSVLRRARGRSRGRASTPSVRKYARSRILIASRFLTWLDEQSLTLATVTQPQLDAWLAGGTATHYRIRDFLRWAHSRQLAGELTVPWLGRREDPNHILDNHERWRLLRRCFHDETMPLHLRVAGALVLLYGQVPQHIVTLTRSHISVADDRTYLTLGQHPVLTPPPLAELLQQLAVAAPTGRRPILKDPRQFEELLFPGSRPQAAMEHGRLTQQLNAVGIQIRPARNGALCSLAADLPAPVMADLLGLHINTAVRWSRLVKRDWASYLAARAEQE